jgi:alpha-tubulin suppressor-like RCC1 family protein
MTVDALLSATKRLEHNTDDDVRMEDVGGLYMWGTNTHGQLGLDSVTEAKTPEVAAQLNHSVMVAAIATLI